MAKNDFADLETIDRPWARRLAPYRGVFKLVLGTSKLPPDGLR